MLDTKWKTILRRAWSVRLIALAGVLSACEVILPLYGDVLPRGLFASLSFASVSGAFIARLVAQKELS